MDGLFFFVAMMLLAPRGERGPRLKSPRELQTEFEEERRAVAPYNEAGRRALVALKAA